MKYGPTGIKIQTTGSTERCLTVSPHTACVLVLTNAVAPVFFFLVPLVAPPPPPPLLLPVITTTPLAAFQCCHHSQGFRQITSEADPLKSITALWRVLRERGVLPLQIISGFNRSQFVQL